MLQHPKRSGIVQKTPILNLAAMTGLFRQWKSPHFAHLAPCSIRAGSACCSFAPLHPTSTAPGLLHCGDIEVIDLVSDSLVYYHLFVQYPVCRCQLGTLYIRR